MERLGSSRQHLWRVCVTMAAVAATLLGLVAPARAQIVERDTFLFADDEVIDDVCDFPIELRWRWEGRYQVRQGKAQETATPFFYHQRALGHEVWTANGTFITVEIKETTQELTATYLGDARFEFTTVIAGTSTVRDARGRPITRNSGNWRYTFVFDKTASPRAPGGQFIELVDVRVNGPKLWDEMSDDDFCALFG